MSFKAPALCEKSCGFLLKVPTSRHHWALDVIDIFNSCNNSTNHSPKYITSGERGMLKNADKLPSSLLLFYEVLPMCEEQ